MIPVLACGMVQMKMNLCFIGRFRFYCVFVIMVSHPPQGYTSPDEDFTFSLPN